MKFISTVFAILITLSLTAQDESRWGGLIGYHQGLVNIAIDGVENDHSMIKLGVLRQVRVNENVSFFASLEFSRLSVTAPSVGLTPAQEFNPSMLSLVLGFKKDQFEGLFYVTGGLLLEYDFGVPDSFQYGLQNGLGIMIGLGKDIHISDTFVLSLEPSLRMRGGINFRTGDAGSFGGNHNLMLDAGVNINFAYKLF